RAGDKSTSVDKKRSVIMLIYQHYDASLLLIGIKLKPQFCVLAVVITTALLSAHKKGFWDRVTSKGPMN
ncbi:hypothetical protein, partial [Lactiplantibacillus plantarum]|uniref:hypothetical protein n=1 Tax=Lactiplantibacillus plantarum TaxID=1590 RepID=UPI003F53ACAE